MRQWIGTGKERDLGAISASERVESIGSVAPQQQRSGLWSAGILLAATAAVLAVSGLLTAGPAYAITPFNGFTCAAGGTNTQTEANLTTVPSSTATVTVAAGERLTIQVVNGQSGTIYRPDITANIIALPAVSTATIDGPVTVTLVTPNIGGGGGLFSTGGPVMSIIFTCSVLGAPPPLVPVPLGPANITQQLDLMLASVHDREPIRVRRIYDSIFDMAGFRWDYVDCCDEEDDFDSFDDYRDALTEAVGDQIRIEREIADAQARLKTASDDEVFDIISELYDLQGEWQQLDDEIGCITDSDFYEPGDIKSAEFASLFGSDTGRAALARISKFYDNGKELLRTQIPLGDVGGWKFSGIVDGGFINSTFGALNAQTSTGSATLLGVFKPDAMTAVGLGLKLGGGTSTTGPNASLNSLQIGADLTVIRELDRGIYGNLYAGYEYGSNSANIGGATGNFGSSTVKFGGGVEGQIPWNNFILIPQITGLVQYTDRAGYTDSTGAAVPGSNFLQYNASAGIMISRQIFMPECDTVVTPKAGLFLTYDSLTGPSFPGGQMEFRPQFIAGLDVNMGNGLKASVQADAKMGQNNFWAAGINFGLEFRY